MQIQIGIQASAQLLSHANGKRIVHGWHPNLEIDFHDPSEISAGSFREDVYETRVVDLDASDVGDDSEHAADV